MVSDVLAGEVGVGIPGEGEGIVGFFFRSSLRSLRLRFRLRLLLFSRFSSSSSR